MCFLLIDNNFQTRTFDYYILCFDNHFLQISPDCTSIKWVTLVNGSQLANAVSSNARDIKGDVDYMNYMIFDLQFRAEPKQYSKFLKRRIQVLSTNDDNDKVEVISTNNDHNKGVVDSTNNDHNEEVVDSTNGDHSKEVDSTNDDCDKGINQKRKRTESESSFRKHPSDRHNRD